MFQSAALDRILSCESRLPGYIGAYIGGSAAALPENAPLPTGSDVDTFVVLSDPPPMKPGKFMHGGILLEVSYIAEKSILPAESALADYHLAHSLNAARILHDPAGILSRLQREIQAKFPLKEEIARRRDHALSRVQSGLTAPLADDLQDRTLGWLFPTGIMAHAALVSALKNPTVRLRYLRAKEVLEKENLSASYETLLSLAGFAEISAETAQRLLNALIPLYDRAAKVGKTPFFFSSDVSPQCRPTAIDSMQALIDGNLHREAMFWILTGYARSMKILLADDPAAYARFLPDFQSALAAVGRDSAEKILSARRRALQFLPELTELTNKIIQNHAKP